MKKRKIIVGAAVLLTAVLVTSSFRSGLSSNEDAPCEPTTTAPAKENKRYQTISLAVSHGHCTLPFEATLENFKVDIPSKQVDYGNITIDPKTGKVRTNTENPSNDPLKQMKVSFDIDPNSFNTFVGEEYTQRLRKDGLFKSEKDQKIKFTTTDVFALGKDWYQLRGKLSIKGVEQDVWFWATPIYQSGKDFITSMVIEGQVNLFDFGIDYDKITTGKSDNVPSKWMYINLNFDFC